MSVYDTLESDGKINPGSDLWLAHSREAFVWNAFVSGVDVSSSESIKKFDELNLQNEDCIITPCTGNVNGLVSQFESTFKLKITAFADNFASPGNARSDSVRDAGYTIIPTTELVRYDCVVIIFTINTKLRDEICKQIMEYGFYIVYDSSCGPLVLRRST